MDDLGRVNHIFCDKTGTLTKNKLSFRSIAFGDKEISIKDNNYADVK